MNPPPNEPAPTAPFTDEDRARVAELVEMADRIASVGGFPREQVDSLTRALAYITYLEGALEAADELARAIRDPKGNPDLDECDQQIQPMFASEKPHPCGWASGADDYDAADTDPAHPGVSWCPRCGFRLREPAPKQAEGDRARVDRERLLLLADEVKHGATKITPEEGRTIARVLDRITHLEGALREIAEDTDHPSWRKAKAIARAAIYE